MCLEIIATQDLFYYLLCECVLPVCVQCLQRQVGVAGTLELQLQVAVSSLTLVLGADQGLQTKQQVVLTKGLISSSRVKPLTILHDSIIFVTSFFAVLCGHRNYPPLGVGVSVIPLVLLRTLSLSRISSPHLCYYYGKTWPIFPRINFKVEKQKTVC